MKKTGAAKHNSTNMVLMKPVYCHPPNYAGEWMTTSTTFTPAFHQQGYTELKTPLFLNQGLPRPRQQKQTSHDCRREVHEVSTSAGRGAPGHHLSAAAQQTDTTARAWTRTVIHCNNYCPASPQSSLRLPDCRPQAEIRSLRVGCLKSVVGGASWGAELC